MKIGFTINLGEFESLKIESSEYDSLIDCLTEIKSSLLYMKGEFKVGIFIGKIDKILVK